MAANINRVVLVGNLTRDPELRHTPSGMAVCSLRIAVNTRRKDDTTGQWTREAELLRHHGLGQPGRELRAVPVEGPPGRRRRAPRMARVGRPGRRRSAQAVEIIADSVQFLGGRGDGDAAGGGNQFVPAGATAGSDADFQGSDDDIPF